MMRVPKTTRLPAEYQEVEYLENNGTCYINTGLSIKDGYRSVQKLRFLAYQTSNGGYVTGGYLGYDSGMGNHARLYVGNGQSGETGWSYGYFGSFTNGTTATATIGTDYDMDFSWISGNAFLKIDGTSYFSSSSTYTTSLSGPVSVFAGYEPNSPVVHPGLRVYSAKYYDSTDTLVRNLVPCYRIADSVIGMYDLVNDTFYTNSGTGTFTKGADIPDMVEKQVRPSEVIECDFTKSDCGFNFKFRSDNDVNYGIDSNGLYTTKTSNAAMVTRGIPSSIYSNTGIKKIVLRLYSTATRNGGGISTNDGQSTTRVWTYFGDTGIENYWNGISSHQDVGNTPAGGYDFTIDLENKVASVSFGAYSLALPDATITAIKSAWSNGNLGICAMMAIGGTTAYIQKATFYF